MSETMRIEQLYVSPLIARRVVDTTSPDWKHFVEYVKTGICAPLSVRMGDRTCTVHGHEVPMYEIVDGQRRFLAAVEAGLQKVPIEKKPGLKTDIDVILFSARQNHHHKSL